MTNTGLNTVNLSSITAFQQSILFVLMLLGNIVIVSTGTVVIRRHFMRKHIQEFLDHSAGARKMVDDIDREENRGTTSSGNGDQRPVPAPRQRRQERKPEQLQTSNLPSRSRHREKGHGGLPYPWEWSISKNLRSRFGSISQPIDPPHHYLSFKPSLDEKVGLYRRSL